MDTTFDVDRRQAYRFVPPPVLEPIFTLIRNGVRTRAETVVDINLRGARVAFATDAALQISPGDNVVASVQAPGLDGCVDFPARVVFSAMKDGRHLLALVFEQFPDIADRVDANFFAVFNRREAERRDAGLHVNAVVLTDTNPNSEPTGFEIRVVNHSRKGIAFVVNKAVDRIINGHDPLNLSIVTHEQSEPERVSARVLHRATRTDSVYYGCMFNRA